MTQPSSRRRFLRGVGGAALALPFLPSLMGREGHAQDAAPGAFITYRITNGFFGQHWYPSRDATDGLLEVVAPNVREMRLSDIAGPISLTLDAGFDALRDKMILMRHVDRLDLADHQAGNGLFGYSKQDDDPEGMYAGLPPSIDRLIAERAFSSPVLPLNLGVRWSSTGASCSCAPDASGNLSFAPSLYPDQAFEQLFGELDLGEDVAARRRRYRRSVVDRVLPHYQRVRNDPRMSRRDRDVLEQHIEHMHSLSTQLSRATAECSAPGRPPSYRAESEMVDVSAQAQVDIAIAALRCGMTRVVNFYLDPDVLFDEALHGIAGGHHGASHSDSEEGVRSVENAHRWHMRYLLDFLSKLEETPGQDGGSMLDDSLVFVNNEIGNQAGRSGGDPGDFDLNHLGLDTQVLLIGSAGGALRTGTFLDYRTDYERDRWTRYVGTAYNRVLITCMLAMGLAPSDWEVGGAPGYGDFTGSLYDKTPLDQVVIGDLRAMLPRVSAT